MFKRPITYTFIDDEDNEVTETEVHWFHLFEEDLLDWEAKYEKGVMQYLEEIVKVKDNEKIVEFFKKIVLESYGIRENGGRSFDKSDELRAEFKKSLAYKQLYKELAFDEDKAAEFLNSIIPKVSVPDQPTTKKSVKNTASTP